MYGGSGCCLQDLLFINAGYCLARLLGCGADSMLLAPTTLKEVRAHGTGERGTRLAERLVAAVHVYQREISPMRPPCCRFTPSCSHYAVEALERHGAARGTWLTVRRLLRCRPGATGRARPRSPHGVRRARRPHPGTALGQTVRVPGIDDASGDLPVSGSLVVPAGALSWRFSRSSGPGGQGVNTADSRVELSVSPLELPGLSDTQRQRLIDRLGTRLVDGVLTIAASEHRQQLRNRQAARERLAAVLRAALAPPPRARRRTKPTRGSQERRIEAKKQRGQLKKQRRTWD